MANYRTPFNDIIEDTTKELAKKSKAKRAQTAQPAQGLPTITLPAVQKRQAKTLPTAQPKTTAPLQPPALPTYAQSLQAAAQAGKAAAQQAEQAQIARQQKIAQSQALLDQGYRPANLYDLTIGSISRGKAQSQMGQEYFKASRGQQNNAAQYEAKLAQDKYRFVPTNTLGRAVSGAGELVGQMLHQWTEPRTLGMAGAAAGTALLAGQAGPQALVPEEILTVPGAALFGFKAGTALSNMEIEAGFAYKEMLENGINPDTAKKISLGVGVVNGALEFMQIDDLMKAFKLLKNNDATKTVASRLAEELARRGVAVGRETAQEVAQEASTLTGVNLANKLEGKELYSKEEVAQRLGDTALQSALSFGVLQAPAGVRNTYHILRTPQATRYSDDAAAEQAAQAQTAEQAAAEAARRQAEIQARIDRVAAEQAAQARLLNERQNQAQERFRQMQTDHIQNNIRDLRQAQTAQNAQAERLRQAIEQNQRQNQPQLPALWQPPIQNQMRHHIQTQTAARHIDNRTEAQIKDRAVNAFQYDHPQIQPFYREQAQLLLGDLQNGIKGKRIYNRDENGYMINVTGQKRYNSEPIVAMLDDGLSYSRIESGLNRIIEDNGKENTVTAKRVEKYLDRALSQGYRSMDGQMPINYEYLNAKSHITGATPNALYQDKETIDGVQREALTNWQAQQQQNQANQQPTLQQNQTAPQAPPSGQRPLIGDSVQQPQAVRFNEQPTQQNGQTPPQGQTWAQRLQWHRQMAEAEAAKIGYTYEDNADGKYGDILPEQLHHLENLLLNSALSGARSYQLSIGMPKEAYEQLFDRVREKAKSLNDADIERLLEAGLPRYKEKKAQETAQQQQQTQAKQQQQEAQTHYLQNAPYATPIPYYTIDENLAKQALAAHSFQTYQQGSATEEYRQMVDAAALIAFRRKEATHESYHKEIDKLLDTYARKLADNLNKRNRLQAAVPSAMITGPGKYSSDNFAKQQKQLGENYKEYENIQALLNKIESTGQAKQDLAAPGNNQGWQFDGGRVAINQELNRLQILFDNVPSEAIRAELKAKAFHWSPRNKAWQRVLTDNAYKAAQEIAALAPTEQTAIQNQQHLIGDAVQAPQAVRFSDNQAQQQEQAAKPQTQTAQTDYTYETNDSRYGDFTEEQLRHFEDLARENGGTNKAVKYAKQIGMSLEEYKTLWSVVQGKTQAERAKKRHEEMKTINAYYRKHKTLQGCPLLTAEEAQNLETYAKQKEAAGNPSYKNRIYTQDELDLKKQETKSAQAAADKARAKAVQRRQEIDDNRTTRQVPLQEGEIGFFDRYRYGSFKPVQNIDEAKALANKQFDRMTDIISDAEKIRILNQKFLQGITVEELFAGDNTSPLGRYINSLQRQTAEQNKRTLTGDAVQPPQAVRFSDQQQTPDTTVQPQTAAQAQVWAEQTQQAQAEQMRQIYNEQMRQAQAQSQTAQERQQQPQAEQAQTEQQPQTEQQAQQAQNEQQEPPHVQHDTPITDADPAMLNQRAVRFIAKAAKKTGLNYRIVNGLDDHIAAYIEGDTIVYNAKTLDDAQAVQKATAHEVYHSLLNTAEHAKLMDMATQYFRDNYGGGKLTLENLIAAKQAEYAENGVTLDYHAALDEIGADFMEIALSDERTANRILTEQPNLAKRILQYIQDKIRDLRTMRNLSEAEKRQYAMLRRAQTIYAQGLKTQAKNRQQENDQESGQDTAEHRYMFLGENARTADFAALDRARLMEREGADMETIRQATGWFKSKVTGGKWAYEINDAGITIDRNAPRSQRETQLMQEQDALNKQYLERILKGQEVPQTLKDQIAGIETALTQERAGREATGSRLGDYVYHPELYKAYPQLADTQLQFTQNEKISPYSGAYNPGDNTITINAQLDGDLYTEYGSPNSNNIDKATGTALHEMQHAVQEYEDFPKGANPSYWFYRTLADLDNPRDPKELYYNTAGEIMARDTANRRNMSQAERQQFPPKMGNERTVYSEDRTEAYSLNEKASQNFARQIKRWANGQMSQDGHFDLGETPPILQNLGAKNLPIIMTQKVMSKINGAKHNIAWEELAKLPEHLHQPLAVMEGSKPDSFVVLTSLIDKRGKNVIAAIHLNQKQKRLYVNRIASVYSKESLETYLRQNIAAGKLKYPDKEKTSAWFTNRGLQLPKLVQTNTDVDAIIADDERLSNTLFDNLTPEQRRKLFPDENRRYSLNTITDSQRDHLANLLRAGEFEQASLYRQQIGMSLMTYAKFRETILPGYSKQQQEARQQRAQERQNSRLSAPKLQTYAQEQAEAAQDAAQQRVRERAEQAGYTTDDSYRMFHRAPNSTDGISQNLTDMTEVFGGENLYSDRAARLFGYNSVTDTADVVRIIQSARNNPNMPVTIYRTVAANVQDNYMRNGDWITLSPDYAKIHGESQFGVGNYRIITEQVPAKHVWNNGDSIYEFGYDDGKAYAYKNTANNKKSLDTVTYDDNGQPIPLNRRFDDQNPDVRYSLNNQSRFAELLDQYGAMQPGEAPHANRDARIPNQTADGNRVRRYVRTAAEAQAVSDETVEAVQDEIGADAQDGLLTYEPESNKRLLRKADDDLTRLGYDEMFRQFTARFVSGERMTARHIAQGERLLVEACRRRDVEGAKELIADIATIGTEMGQAVQALRLLKRMTPEGRLVAIQRIVTRINGQIEGRGKVELSEERIQDILSQETPEGLDAAERRAISDIAEQVPATLEDKIRAWRYMSMLGNGRTLIRNTFGNFAFVPVRMIKNTMSLATEQLLPAGAERTKVLHIKPEYRAFAESYFETIKDQLAEGSNYSDMFTRVEQEKRIFKNPVLEKWRTLTTDLMKMTDMWVKKPAYIRALASYAQANNFTPEYLKSGTRQADRDMDRAAAYAWDEAMKTTYQEQSAAAEFLNKLERQNAFTKVIVGGLMPFKKTPINIIKRGVRYSPAGLIEGITRGSWQLHKKDITPAQFIDKLTSGMTGTMIAGLGAWMAASGLLAAGDDDDPKKKATYDRALGAQNYALKLPGGGTYSIDWLAPSVMPLLVGAEAYLQVRREKENTGDATILSRTLESIGKISDPVLEMSMMQGILNSLQSFRDGSGQLSDIAASAITGYGGQFIPTLAGQAARTIDDTRRSTYAPSNSPITPTVERFLRQSAAKIPGLSMQLEPQVDMWGREIKQPGENIGMRALNNFLNPGNYRPNTATTVDDKLTALYDKTGKTKVLPATIGKSIDYDGKKYPLKASEYTDMQKQIGSKRYQDVQKFQQSTYVKKRELDDAQQANIIASLYEYRADQAKEVYLKKRGIPYENDAYYKIKAAEQNGVSPVDYLAVKQIFGGDYDKAKVMYDDAKYLGITPKQYLQTKKAFGKGSGDTYDQAAHKLLICQAIGMTPEDYQTVYKTLGQIKGDEKEDGSTVQNSKRDKTFAYINTLPISKGAKEYLMYTRYPKTDKGQIAPWLNKLPLTKSQKQQLYQTHHNPNQTTYNRWIDTLNISQEAKTKLKNRPYGAETAQIRRYINALPGLTKAEKQALWEQKAPE